MIHESVSAAAPGLEGAAGKRGWGSAEWAELETETGGPSVRGGRITCIQAFCLVIHQIGKKCW